MRNSEKETENSSIPIIYTVTELTPGGGESVQVVIETDKDISGRNVWLLVRRGKYPVPIKNEFHINSSIALKSMTKTAGASFGYILSQPSNSVKLKGPQVIKTSQFSWTVKD